MIARVKWQTATHHLVHDHTHSPPVNGSAIIIVLEYLEREGGGERERERGVRMGDSNDHKRK